MLENNLFFNLNYRNVNPLVQTNRSSIVIDPDGYYAFFGEKEYLRGGSTIDFIGYKEDPLRMEKIPFVTEKSLMFPCYVYELGLNFFMLQVPPWLMRRNTRYFIYLNCFLKIDQSLTSAEWSFLFNMIVSALYLVKDKVEKKTLRLPYDLYFYRKEIPPKNMWDSFLKKINIRGKEYQEQMYIILDVASLHFGNAVNMAMRKIRNEMKPGELAYFNKLRAWMVFSLSAGDKSDTYRGINNVMKFIP